MRIVLLPAFRFQVRVPMSEGDGGSSSGSVFQMGPSSLSVPMSMFADNRRRLCDKLKEGGEVTKGAIVLLQGGKQECFNNTDIDVLFRQESYFHWLFGVTEGDCYGALEVDSARSVLFFPRLPDEYAIWMGQIYPLEHFQRKYEVDEIHYTDEVASVLEKKQPSMILTLYGENTDSGSFTKEADFDGIERFKDVINNSLLHPVITECRVIKTEDEKKILRYANKISSMAHCEVMRAVKPGMAEYELESLFQHLCYSKGGMRHLGYTCICASGHSTATLHYGHAGEPNSYIIQDGTMCLFDMGGEYYRYSSDITCTFPANGVFTEQQKHIYNAVLKANRAVLAAVKPGVKWTDMHCLAERVELAALKEAGLVKGEVEDMMAVRLGAVFMPHGLGHFLGIDTHDVGGYPKGIERSSEAGLKNLRTARELKEGMCITVEPGIYFIDHVLDKALSERSQARFINEDVLKKYRRTGGVRIEDDILVTATGVEVLTDVPRTVAEVEAWMQRGEKTWTVPKPT